MKDESRKSLLGMDQEELEQFVSGLGLNRYRGRQIYEWIYSKRASEFRQMSSLSEAIRESLANKALVRTLKLLDKQTSTDGTIKFLFRTIDNLNVESVLIPSEARNDQDVPKRRTLCLSSQVGCPLDCKFCATGTMKLKRNLTAGEIIEQFIRVEEESSERISNIVYMGMGEPLLNVENVLESVRLLSSPSNKMVPASRITVSTSGIVPGIEKLAQAGLGVKLAISLHETLDSKRSELMPINRKYPLTELMNAVEAYYRITRKPITYEYILFRGRNESENDAKRLAKISKRVPSKVNVIPFHPINFTEPTGIAASLEPSTEKDFNRFIAILKLEGAQVMVRSSSGLDIEAACGQLAITHADTSL